MPVDGIIREYTWEDIKSLILIDLNIDPTDREYHDFWYLGNFQEPKYIKDPCIRVVKYVKNYRERLEENMKEKI